MDAFTDEELLTLFKHGNREAFERLYERHKRDLFLFLLRMCQDRPFAEELMQDVLLKVARAAATYQPRGRFKPWMYRIASNHCLNALASRGQRALGRLVLLSTSTEQGAASMESQAAKVPGPSDEAEGREARRSVLEAIEELDPRYRAALLQRVTASLRQGGRLAPALQAHVSGLPLDAVSRLASGEAESSAPVDALAPSGRPAGSAIGVLEDLLGDALQAGASDIHLEPLAAGGRVRFRIDGLLHTRSEVSAAAYAALAETVKSAVAMDPRERCLPQDSRLAVVAQRLVRLLCPACREPDEQPSLPESLASRASLPAGTYFRARGCELCFGTGCRGRTAVYELAEAADADFGPEVTAAQLRASLIQRGSGSFLEDGLAKAATGQIALTEVVRVCVS